MTTGQQIAAVAMRYKGLPYVLGAEAQLPSNLAPNPIFPAALDCSELVQVTCHVNDIDAPDGTVNQYPWSTRCPVDIAIGTPGALLFIWKGSHAGGGNGNHVAISRGDGTTIEARGRRYGVDVFPAHGRGWNAAGLIPGVDYREPPQSFSSSDTDQEDEVGTTIHEARPRGDGRTQDILRMPLFGATAGGMTALSVVFVRQLPRDNITDTECYVYSNGVRSTFVLPRDGRTIAAWVGQDGLQSVECDWPVWIEGHETWVRAAA